MTPIQLPKVGDDVVDLWKPVARCARAINAIAKLRGQGVNFTLDDDGAYLKVDGSGTGGGSGNGDTGIFYLQVITNGVIAYVSLGSGASVVATPPDGGIPIN